MKRRGRRGGRRVREEGGWCVGGGGCYWQGAKVVRDRYEFPIPKREPPSLCTPPLHHLNRPQMTQPNPNSTEPHFYRTPLGCRATEQLHFCDIKYQTSNPQDFPWDFIHHISYWWKIWMLVSWTPVDISREVWLEDTGEIVFHWRAHWYPVG